MAAENIETKLMPGKSTKSGHRFLGAIRRTGFGYGTVQLPINEWTVDETNPPIIATAIESM